MNKSENATSELLVRYLQNETSLEIERCTLYLRVQWLGYPQP